MCNRIRGLKEWSEIPRSLTRPLINFEYNPNVAPTGDVPIHLHADDHRWIMRPDPSIQLWKGETLKLLPDVTLIRCGGIFQAAPYCIGPRAPAAEGYCACRTSRR
jgi:hypothetical protein